MWHPTAAPGVAGVIYHEGGNSPWYTSYGTEIILPCVLDPSAKNDGINMEQEGGRGAAEISGKSMAKRSRE